MSAVIEDFTAHPIDLAKEQATEEAIPKDAELDSYISGLLEWAYKDQDVRQFAFAQETTEVRTVLQSVITGQKLSSVASIIANRLLRWEKAAHKEVAHLKGVHEGMLLQAVFRRKNTRGILLAKVDLSEFLGRNDFRSHSGIDKKHRLLKFCLVEFADQHGIQEVQIGDTNSTISVYWWKDFLELTELRTDSLNTKTAFAVFDTFLGKALKKDYPRDYPNLFNEVLRKFKRNQSFKFSKFLDDIFDNYRPFHSNLDVPALKARAKDLLAKNKFDANFTILPSEIEKRFKRTYTLTPQIELTVAGELVNLADQISALVLTDGTKGVFVKSESGYNQFPVRETIPLPRLKCSSQTLKKQKSDSSETTIQTN